MITDYLRAVQYHETDKMGVTHHSNYIKWMEEARIDFLNQIGFGYAKLERDGIISPVIGVDCKYLRSTTFGDTVRIRPEVDAFSGVRLVIRYTMWKEGEEKPVLTGFSTHCFTTPDGRPVILKKQFPAFAQVLTQLAQATGGNHAQ